ncbi:MAG: hypothetical protein ACR2N4_12680 [Jatrophihabitans sp.]
MNEDFEPALGAHVTRDDHGRARAIRHTQEYWAAEAGSPVQAAVDYVRAIATTYEIAEGDLTNLHVDATHLDPREQGVEYRIDERISAFDSTTVGFDQTVLNTPVWGGGLRVTVKEGPNRVVASVDTSHPDLEVSLPSEAVIERYRQAFRGAEVARALDRSGAEADEDFVESQHTAGTKLIAEVLGSAAGRRRRVNLRPRLIRGRFWIYRYVAADRLPRSGQSGPIEEAAGESPPEDPLTLPLPAVSDEITDGRHYLVAEITFEAAIPGRERLTWQALVELQTGSALYLRALSGDVNGYVMTLDPPTKLGNTSVSSASNNTTLNPLRDDVTLPNLGAPVAGAQSLAGTYLHLAEVEGEVIAAPTVATGSDFLYPTRTNDFAAVSAYFHVDRLFRTIADLGFTVTGPSGYFHHTNFPIPVDHRCFTGNVINAHCVGDGLGGIGHVGYGIMDLTDTTNPLGRAADPRVTWHEVCGHGILYERVNSANFGFAHSAGDSLSEIFFDPDSRLSGVDGTALGKPGDLRFTYVPWHPTLDRRSDRTTAAGWAWNGSHDDQGYGSEEILETTLFRVYRSIGGDSSDPARRRFASRMAMYLILRAVQSLTPATNPAYARDFATALMSAGDLNWTSEGIDGGAYGKVIRWSFELQGEYQVPLVLRSSPNNGSITTRGLPPQQDVYIDDGRAGEYQFQPVHWHTTTVWNRRTADNLPGHQEPELGATNYAYVKVKNRGTQTATGVVVKGYHTKPMAGLLWPNDFEPFTTPSISVGTLLGNNAEEKVIGPFEWTPTINALGHDCMLMIVSSDGDTSNVDKFTAGESIPEWRLVPNDNNIAQRNVVPVPGGGETAGLMAGLNEAIFWLGNPNPKGATMTVAIDLPELLSRREWKVGVEGIGDGTAFFKSGEQRPLCIRVQPGHSFTRADVERAPAEIVVKAYADGNLVGGMTYALDPNIRIPHNRKGKDTCRCQEPAEKLLDCLGLPGQDVASVHVKEIVIGLRIRDDGCC